MFNSYQVSGLVTIMQSLRVILRHESGSWMLLQLTLQPLVSRGECSALLESCGVTPHHLKPRFFEDSNRN